MASRREPRSAKSWMGTARKALFLAPVALCLAVSSFVEAGSSARALRASSTNDLEMLTSLEPSHLNRFDPHTGSLLAPFMIPRVSGTPNNTLVQEFILDFFSKLNQTSLSGTNLHSHIVPHDLNNDQDMHDTPISKAALKKRAALLKHKEKYHTRAEGVSGIGWHLEVDTFTDPTPFGPKNFTNLIFTKNPKAENRLVFAAHFDSKYLPPAGKPKAQWNGGLDTQPFIAATDSAVPCAILLDLAASLDEFLDSPERTDKDTTLQLIFFDGEEAFEDWTATDSLYGSRHLAELWQKRTVQRTRTATGRNGGSTSNNLAGIELFVLLDLLGADKPTIPSYFGTTQWAHRHAMSIEQRLWDAKLHGQQVLNRKEDSKRASEQGMLDEDDHQMEADDMDDLEEDHVMQGFLTSAEPWGGVDDDHRPFLHRGVPIFHVIPTPFPKVWHTLADNADAISAEVVEGWANIFRTFTAEYLYLLNPRQHRRDEL